MLDLLNRVWMHISAQSPATIVITSFALFVIFMLWYETYKQTLDWRDLITNPSTNRVSLTKVLQLVGGVVGTWIMVIVTLQGKITSELLFTYLAYVGAIEGWSKFITAKYGATGDVRPYNRPGVMGYGYGNRYGGGYQPEYEQTGQTYPPPRNPSAPPAAKPPMGDDTA